MQDTNIASFRRETTRQLTTFDLARRTKTIRVARGQRVALSEVRGRGYIAQLWLTFSGWFWQHWAPDEVTSQTLLKTLIVRIYWDGSERPAVECPVGDFFGNGLCMGANFTSRYFGMSSGGFYCKFPMPFRTGFRIEFENLDPHVDTEIFANVLYQLTDDESLPERGYFHTQFRTGRNAGPDPVPMLEAHGRGHYVGCVLSMQAASRNYLSYLEAPEYVYVDDDWETPRIVGTGLEDYFLGGWYFREGEFTGELHGVPCKDGLNGSVAMYRVHEADAIRFERRVRFEFVNPWEPERLKPFAYSSAAFCYLDTPEGQGKPLPAVDESLCWYRVRDTDRLSVP